MGGTCEYKHTVNHYCYPYHNDWCDDTGPLGQGLVCAQYSNPYGSSYGVCQCDSYSFHNGTVCIPRLLYNGNCTATSDCEYRLNLTCSGGVCTCPSGYNYELNGNITGFNGSCVQARSYLGSCSSTSQCRTSLGLYCNTTGGGICVCNDTKLYWDGTMCVAKLTIGGLCSSNASCLNSLGLFCSHFNQSAGTCDCDQNNFWNNSCLNKYTFNQSCTWHYECNDNVGLQCQSGLKLAPLNSTTTAGTSVPGYCECHTGSVWNFYTNQSQSCIPTLGYNKSTCWDRSHCEPNRSLECRNYTCLCNTTDYWDGNACQPKKDYLYACNNTYECLDGPPKYLVCLMGPASVFQCICNSTSFWESCNQRCATRKKYLESCMLPGSNCSTNECELNTNLECLNNTGGSPNSTMGWCNCTSLRWWNGSYCREKGIPAWGINGSAVCNATYQCADYNLVSCPLGGSSLVRNATCECATTKYWNGFTCLDRAFAGQPCTSWPSPPVSTSTCLSAAGAGLSCNATTCNSTGCYGGTCFCPAGSTWNSTFLICYTPPSTG